MLLPKCVEIMTAIVFAIRVCHVLHPLLWVQNMFAHHYEISPPPHAVTLPMQDIVLCGDTELTKCYLVAFHITITATSCIPLIY